MLTRRLRAKDRAPSALAIASGFLTGRRLTFDKIGKDGSGKCDAEHTGEASHRVYGVVFDVATRDKYGLDHVEGVGWGYEIEPVAVVSRGGVIDALTYIATHKRRGLQPFHWYKAMAIAGAIEHLLPRSYVDWLRGIESVEDRDEERRAANEAILLAR